jgi:phage/plasmid-like protein (TIGR03299 family)
MTEPTVDYDPTVSDWGSKFDVAEGPNHQIDETVGGFASVRVPAWHKLGVVVENQVNAPTLLRLAGANYQIFRGPITTEIEVPITPGSPLTVKKQATDPRRVNICRQHPLSGELEILGQASPGYPLWTPYDVLVGFGDGILTYGEPTVSTCGVLDGGRRVFMAFKLPKDIKVGGIADETTQLWLVVTTSFDQSEPTAATITPIRAVCANTVRAGVAKAKSRFTIKKTRNADLQAAQARTALKLVDPFIENYDLMANTLLDIKVTNARFLQIIEANFGPGEEPSKTQLARWEPKKDKLMELFTVADTQANVRGTAWAALNAVGEYADWFTKVKKTDADADAARFRRSVEGNPAIAEPKDAMLRSLMALA